MHVAPDHGQVGHDAGRQPDHHWVGAALVGLGQGPSPRAEHAARTGRHVLPGRTRIEVLEVYCATCRIPFSERACALGCTVRPVRAVRAGSPRAS